MKKSCSFLSTLLAVFVITSLLYSQAHSQSQTSSGTVYSWGSHVLAVEENIGFVDIVAGKELSLALHSDGQIYSWDPILMVKVQYRLAW